MYNTTRLERQGWKIAFLFRTLMRWKFNVDIYTDGRYRVFYFSLYDARNALNIKILLVQSRWDKLFIYIQISFTSHIWVPLHRFSFSFKKIRIKTNSCDSVRIMHEMLHFELRKIIGFGLC